MAHVIVCDVCEKQVGKKEWDADPGIEAVIPQELMGDVGEPLEATFCSWACLVRIARHYAAEGVVEEVEEEDEEPVPTPVIVPTNSAATVGQHFQMPQVTIKR